jgi:UDP-N-acetylglucosamine diphosphorylase/glucosamine-1-phosphate N-acetyltransferase
MDKIIFTEEFCQPENLHPFTLTRQIQDIRIGILTIREKWEQMLGLPSFDKKEDDYKDLEASTTISDAAEDGGVCYMIHGNVLPTPKMVKAVKKLQNGEFLSVKGRDGIVFRFTKDEIKEQHKIRVKKAVTIREEVTVVQYPWNIFQLNDQAIRLDFEWLTRKRKSQPISKTNKVNKPSEVFLEKGAQVEHCIINASTGPVYIGKNAEIMEGCVIRGPFAMGEGALLKMGTKVYGATTLGPGCVGGGEIKNTVMFGYSNKAHDGYLGDSVIGEWCNLGAGTTNSNLKNNAGQVRVWTPNGEMDAGQKCGVIIPARPLIQLSIRVRISGPAAMFLETGLPPNLYPVFPGAVRALTAMGSIKLILILKHGSS